ncbi:hypothetical protein HV436_18535 [Bacillus sporothermodurans]|nr:hypothetical protein [Heyndrickxia sporothermodurans]MBL5783427.1 hypothetical protein [Heyndrickxia sporothermodurans]MBL5790440.1 hypothetical protein [Heyndrickxia sporothermodurans]MBL5797983.1 hypothetical protein [Heyndrickxia sporothermodurans]MBL5801406.1 hypothetical protein [Heyndrickxia sporothermodurans]
MNYDALRRKREEINLETYTTDQAAQKALEWCEVNKGWKRICDIEDSDSLYKTWDELPKKIKNYWIKAYGEYSAESAWKEFGESYCKFPKGFITGKGEFYENVLDVPLYHNLMMVFKVG